MNMAVPEGTFLGRAHPSPSTVGFCLEHYQLLINLTVQLGCLYLHTIYLPPWCPAVSPTHSRCSVRKQSKRGCPGGVPLTSGCLLESQGLGIYHTSRSLVSALDLTISFPGARLGNLYLYKLPS